MLNQVQHDVWGDLRPNPLNQSQPRQLPQHRGRHSVQIIHLARPEIRRRILRLQIAPPLMRPLRRTPHRDQPGFQPDPEPPLPRFLKPDQRAAPHQPVLMYPVKRPALHLRHPLGQIARGQSRLCAMTFQPRTQRRRTFTAKGDLGEMKRHQQKMGAERERSSPVTNPRSSPAQGRKRSPSHRSSSSRTPPKTPLDRYRTDRASPAPICPPTPRPDC